MGIGDLANALIGPASFTESLIIAACIVTGIVFITFSFLQYKVHRQNPKLVPFSTPLTYFVLGVLVGTFSFFVQSIAETGKTYSAPNKKVPIVVDIDRPISQAFR